MICRRRYLVFLMLPTFMLSRKQEQSLHLYTSITKRANDIQTLKLNPLRHPYFGKKNLSIFCLGRGQCDFADKNTKNTLIINEHIRLTGIPDDAHHYLVDGKTPLEWFINRYKITPPEKNNGILNDPNGWVQEPPRPHHSNRTHHPRQRRIHQNY